MTGAGVVVGIIDFGLDYTLEDFSDQAGERVLPSCGTSRSSQKARSDRRTDSAMALSTTLATSILPGRRPIHSSWFDTSRIGEATEPM